MKKVLAAGLTAVMAMSLMVGCGSKKDDSSSKTYNLGIIQFAEHGSLDNCRKGFLKGLESEGIKEGENLKITYKNSQADTATDNQIASNFASKKLDMICAIATPSAQSAYNAAMKADIPVIYTAVTDPVAAELADKDGKPVGEVTGTSDKLPVEEQLKMIREMLPDAKKIGIMYTTSEANSVSALAKYKELAGDYGFTIVDKGIAQTADISLATDELLTEVDCLTNLTDNTVVASLATILDKANKQNIPVFGSEIEQVKIGCLAAEGLDYVALGKQTGKMAAKVLKGEEKAKDMKFETFNNGDVIINTAAAKKINMTISKDVQKQAKQTFDKISAPEK